MREKFPRTRSVIVARLLVAVVVVLIALLGGADVSRSAVVLLVVAVGVLTLVYLLWHSRWGNERALLYTQCALDVVFITVLAHFSGGLASPFKLLYFLPVIVGAGRLGSSGGIAIACGAVAGHFVLAMIGPSSWSYLLSTGALAEIATLLVSLVLVAALEGHLARKASESEERLRATRSELSTAQLRIADILDSVSSGLALIDSGGAVAYLNKAGEAILSVGEAEARGRDYRLVFAEVPAFCDRIAAALEAGNPEARTEFHVRNRRGGSTPVGLSTSILRSAEGEERGVIAIFQDLTDARRTEERLRHDDRLSALGAFAAGVAHEIRNPLYAIKGSVDLLKDAIEPEGDQLRLIRLISRETDRMNMLLQDVLHYGRMDTLDRRPVTLGPLISETIELARNHPSMRPEIEFDVEAGSPAEAFVDPEQIRRALLNLAINAVEAIDGPGRVRISVVPARDFAAHGLSGGQEFGVALIVEDTGKGIPAEDRDQLFKPFHTTKKGGTGLGLAIVDKTVQAHGGRVAVISEADKGSKFIVYLPAQ
ncbi:MAG: PAS domain S-box protein [Candidatus Eisenbacteria bacterium]|nr:PAS domain S-box protein [Candidatus Eisenbacteria bacterium]